MKEIEKGLFVVEETMPCSPRAIWLGRYILPSTLGRMEREEAAARILLFSHQLDQWVGVSWPRLGEMMREDFRQYQLAQEELDQGLDQFRLAERHLRRYYILSICTLGLWALFHPKPTETLMPTTKSEMPLSGIFVFGPQHVVTGVHELLEQGLLRRETASEEGKEFDVLFPTPGLVSLIMGKQGIVAC